MFLEYCTVFCFVGFRWSSVLFLEKCLPLFNITYNVENPEMFEVELQSG